MCGIIGVVVNNPVGLFNKLKNIYENQKSRGTGGCGIAVLRNGKLFRLRGRDANKLFKATIFTNILNNLQVGDLVLIHHRFGTTGADGRLFTEANHPIMNEKKDLALIHNGCISNYKDLYFDLKKQGHWFETQITAKTKKGLEVWKDITDSEVIVHLIEQYGIEGVNKVSGSVAIAYLTKQENCIYLYGTPISVYKDDENYYFSSQQPSGFNNIAYLSDSYLFTLDAAGLHQSHKVKEAKVIYQEKRPKFARLSDYSKVFDDDDENWTY